MNGLRTLVRENEQQLLSPMEFTGSTCQYTRGILREHDYT